MSEKFHSLHASEISWFLQKLRKNGFKSKPKAQWELHRLEHNKEGKVIIYNKNTGNPWPKINDNGYRLFQLLKGTTEITNG